MSEKMDFLEAMDLNEAIDLAAAMDLNDAMDPGTLPIQEDKLSVGKLKHGYAPRMLACYQRVSSTRFHADNFGPHVPMLFLNLVGVIVKACRNISASSSRKHHRRHYFIWGFRCFLCSCKHYRRRCRIRAPCCNEIFDCRHCHNEAKVHIRHFRCSFFFLFVNDLSTKRVSLLRLLVG